MKFFKKLEVVLTLITLAIVGMAAAIFFAVSLPLPKTSIEFKGCQWGKNAVFLNGELQTSTNPTSSHPGQTNIFCDFCMDNSGSTEIYWTPREYEVEARTPAGWVTNSYGDPFVYSSIQPPSTKCVFSIYVPMDAIEWRVSGWYEYDKRHNLIDYFRWADRRTLSLFPDPQPESVHILSELFTNPPQLMGVTALASQ